MRKYLEKFSWRGALPQGALACVGLDCGTGSTSRWPLLDPAGPIGADEKWLILVSLGIMLTVVIPVIVMALGFAWKYRASNTSATYTPKWDYSGKIEAVVWIVPTIIVIFLSVLVWRDSHSLSPYRPIPSAVKPIQVEAVSLDWKWLFIYPELGIATVNRVVFPKDVPVNFKLTSDTVMTSFFIPQLGSQIFAMAGMQTKLHLLADRTGTFEGLNSQYSGDGFSSMNFKAIATSQEDFDAWVKQVKQSPKVLDEATFLQLEKRSAAVPVTYYSTVKPKLFQDIIRKYMANPPAAGKPGQSA